MLSPVISAPDGGQTTFFGQTLDTSNPAPGYKAFTRDGKAVFQVEYRIPRRRFCARASRLGISSIKKASNFSLNARPWRPCR